MINVQLDTGECSPRTWGLTDIKDTVAAKDGVFPTNVGINRRYSETDCAG